MSVEENLKSGVTKTKQLAPVVEQSGSALTHPLRAYSTANMLINAEV
jgi:hypothetical protein